MCSFSVFFFVLFGRFFSLLVLPIRYYGLMICLVNFFLMKIFSPKFLNDNLAAPVLRLLGSFWKASFAFEVQGFAWSLSIGKISTFDFLKGGSVFIRFGCIMC